MSGTRRIKILDKPKERIRILDEPKRRIDPHELARRLGGKVCDPPPQFAQLAAPYLDFVFCEHANENPGVCRCPADCACRERMCRDKSEDGGEMQIKYGPSFPRAKYGANMNVPRGQDANDRFGKAWDDLVVERHLTPEEQVDFRAWCRGRGMDLDKPNRRHLDAELVLWMLAEKATPFDYLVLAFARIGTWWKGLWR